MSETTIVLERAGPVALLRLNRPKRLNALNDALMIELADALEALDGDARTRAVVITGDDRAFAAGADIGELSQPGGPQLDVWDRLWAAGLPTIAAVRGLALGGGLELAMSCDLLVVADDARLGQPEIELGLIPGAGGTQRLTRALGKTTAMEMVLLGRQLSGTEAYARGLANACVPPERVLAKALAAAHTLARKAPLAVRAAKRHVLAAFEEPLAAGLQAERRTFRALLSTADGREGVAAFNEKRKPAWSGK
ncbi:MAG: enoyl-CoA hydratase-related protein [Candidatus Velthaea sp.]